MQSQEPNFVKNTEEIPELPKFSPIKNRFDLMRLPNDEKFVRPTSERTLHIKEHHPYQCTSLSEVSNSVLGTVKVSRRVNVTYFAFRLETHSLAFNSIICCAFCIKSKSCYVFAESH